MLVVCAGGMAPTASSSQHKKTHKAGPWSCTERAEKKLSSIKDFFKAPTPNFGEVHSILSVNWVLSGYPAQKSGGGPKFLNVSNFLK